MPSASRLPDRTLTRRFSTIARSTHRKRSPISWRHRRRSAPGSACATISGQSSKPRNQACIKSIEEQDTLTMRAASEYLRSSGGFACDYHEFPIVHRAGVDAATPPTSLGELPAPAAARHCLVRRVFPGTARADGRHQFLCAGAVWGHPAGLWPGQLPAADRPALLEHLRCDITYWPHRDAGLPDRRLSTSVFSCQAGPALYG